MKQKTGATMALGVASVFVLTVGLSTVWANEPGYGKGGHMGSGHGSMSGYGAGMKHGGTGQLIRHLLQREQEIGLTAEQVTKLKDMQLNLDKVRIRTEADIKVAEREVSALTENEKSDLGAVEAKLKQSHDLQVGLRMVSIKAKRDVLAVLTPEQRAKEKTEHAKIIQQHRDSSRGYGNPHGGAMKGNPHMGGDPAHPTAP